eukprot:6904-Heterococcus_DN1.PRE.2
MPSPPRRQHAADSALMAPPSSRLPAAPELYGIYEGQGFYTLLNIGGSAEIYKQTFGGKVLLAA